MIKNTMNDWRTERRNPRKRWKDKGKERERGEGCLRPLPTHFLGHL